MQTTIVHELGHFPDRQDIGTAKQFASQGDDIMQGWRTAVNNSSAYQDLFDKLNNPSKHAIEMESLFGGNAVSGTAHIAYEISPRREGTLGQEQRPVR